MKAERLPFFNANVISELENMDFTGKMVAQFCCNNGRELLSLMQLGSNYGVGFDIAENIIGQARETARKSNITNCDFIACNILEVDESYHNKFDFIYFTIGAIPWFENLTVLFKKVAMCLKTGGTLLINEFHPFMNMLPMPGEDGFDKSKLNQLMHSYFKKEPWLENDGMSYMAPTYKSKTFTSFSHTLSSIINSTIAADMTIKKLSEYDYDVGLSDVYDGKGYPLSFILLAEKQ